MIWHITACYVGILEEFNQIRSNFKRHTVSNSLELVNSLTETGLFAL